MKVLYCVSEVAPIIKVGGLGDVAGSLPKALAKLGVEISIVVPKYEEIDVEGFKEIGEFKVEFDGKKENVAVWQTKLPNSQVPVFLLENKKYLSKGSHQAFAGTTREIDRFSFFSKAIVQFVNFQLPITNYQLLHLNDWHTSLVPLLLSTKHKLPTLLTIHNLSYKGISGLNLLSKINLSTTTCRVLKWDARNRNIDILMEGIIHADFVNTVSPTYSKEIMTKKFGCGIEEVLKGKEGRVTGILNGIDGDIWDPMTDPNINFKFQIPNFKLGKAENKKTLQQKLKLDVNDKIPLLAFIGRLDLQQKGLDILYKAIVKMLVSSVISSERSESRNLASALPSVARPFDFTRDDRFTCQFIILGTGNKTWEKKFSNETMKQFNNYCFINKFDERLAHQIYAGADFILVPSRFEPCGLPQMIGMRYGALPIVRKVGGLADTVKDGVNGFVFEEYSSKALTKTIKKAVGKFKMAHGEWERMVKTAMETDFSWDKSAKEYFDLYTKIINLKTATPNFL